MLDTAHLVSNLEDEVSPDDVEDKEEGEEEVEDIVGREHLEYLASLNACGEYDNGGVVGQPGVNQVRENITKEASQTFWYLVYLASLASSSQWSAKSCIRRTTEPIVHITVKVHW